MLEENIKRKKYAWETLSDEQLLKRRLSSLRVTVDGTWLEDCVSSLHEELEERGIRLRPHRGYRASGSVRTARLASLSPSISPIPA